MQARTPRPAVLLALLAGALALSGCGSAFLALSSDDDDDDPPRTATAPIPASGATDVDVLLAQADPIGSLRWSPAPGLLGQTLRLAETEEDLEVDPLIETAVLGSSLVVWSAGLEPDTEYVWRVDTRFEEGPGETEGEPWTFRTSPSRREAEPNDGPLQATSLALGRTLLADLGPGAGADPDFDWFRVGLQAGRLYALELDALSLAAESWSAAGACPEFELIDAAGNEVLWRHAFPFARIDSAEDPLYARPLDLAIPRLSVEETGLYFVRARAVALDGVSNATVDGAAYALRLRDLGTSVRYETETRDQSQETGFSNDSVIVAEPFSLDPDPDDPDLFGVTLSGFLVSGLEEGTPVPPAPPLPLVSGFDWFRFALPSSGDLFEIQVELHATRQGAFRPDTGGGFGDLELNYFRSAGFATTAPVSFDLDSFRGGDPSFSLVGRAGNGLLQSQFIGVAHDPDFYQAQSFGTFTLADAYSLAGVPFALDVHARRLVPGDSLVEEQPGDNDEVDQAQPMDYGQWFQGNLANGADAVDWIEFEGQAGDVVSIELFDPNRTFGLEGSAATSDLELTLFRVAGGAPIDQPAENTTATPLASPLLNQRRYLQAILRDTGTFALELRSMGPAIAPGGFEYLVRLERLQASTYESEPNNAPETADPDLLTASTVAGELFQLIGADEDHFAFSAAEGELVRVELFAGGDPATSLDLERAGFGGVALPRLDVLDGEGSVLRSAVSEPTPEIAFASAERLSDPLPNLHLLFEAPADDTYVLRVSDLGLAGLDPARYALRLERE